MDRSAQKKSIMDYLPEQEKAKLKKLVERLAQETQEKQRYKKMYEQMCDKYATLQSKYQEAEAGNSDLRAQIAASRMAINKAKQAYIASKSARKTKRQEEPSRMEQEELVSTQTLKETWLKIPKTSTQKQQKQARGQKSRYIFQQDEQEYQGEQEHGKDRRPPPAPARAEDSSMKKTVRGRGSQNSFQSSNKKQQILNLRKQIESLTEQIEHKQRNGLPLTQKIKKCEEIKRRYLKSQQKINSRRVCQSQEQQEELLDPQPAASRRTAHTKQANKPQQQSQQEPSLIQVEKTNRVTSIKLQQQPSRPKIHRMAANSKVPNPEPSLQASNPNPKKPRPHSQNIDQSLFTLIDHLNCNY